MSERFPLERVVGEESPEEHEYIRDLFKERFLKQEEQEDLKGKERPKTPEEQELISFINEETSKAIVRYGGAPLQIPQENIRIIHRWASFPIRGHTLDKAGGYQLLRQRILVREQKTLFEFAVTAFHEMLHVKMHNAAQVVVRNGKRYIAEYRTGLITRSRDGEAYFFLALEEAIIEELTARHGPTLRMHPLLRREKEEEDRFLERLEPLARQRLLGTIGSEYMYEHERALLRALTEVLAETFPETCATPDDAFALFVRASVTGNMLPVARLVERCLGRGAWRCIGKLSEDQEEIQAFLHAIGRA